MTVELLMSPGCANGERTATLLQEVAREAHVEAEIAVILVATEAHALRLGFPGSPTVRIDGLDVEPDPPTRIGLG